jgi:heme A synthase
MTKILLHRYVVVAAACTLLLSGVFAPKEFPNHAGLKAVAIVLLPTLFLQLMLGVLTYMSILLARDRPARGAFASLIAATRLGMDALLWTFHIVFGIEANYNVLPKIAPLPVSGIQAVL